MLVSEPIALADRLRDYPNLARVLGTNWIKREQSLDPALSRFALARWLRISGFEDDLATLDRVIAQLGNHPNFKERKERLRKDPESVMETLCELYFGAWLQSLGYNFEIPTAGADFAIEVGHGSVLYAEITTPRRAVWSNDLFERVDLLTERYGYSARMEFGRETMPASMTSAATVSRIVADSIKLLSEQTALPSVERIRSLTQNFPEEKLSIVWTLVSDTPRVSAFDSPEPSSPWLGFRFIVEAAERKSHQLPRNQGGLVVVGTRQLPALAWLNFMESLRIYPASEVPFDWSQLPLNIKHVLLYEFVMRQIPPTHTLLITNDHSSLPDPVGFEALAQVICPHPFRTAG